MRRPAAVPGRGAAAEKLYGSEHREHRAALSTCAWPAGGGGRGMKGWSCPDATAGGGAARLERDCHQVWIAAAGLEGEGSECFGYDDVSPGHDWAPAFVSGWTGRRWPGGGGRLRRCTPGCPRRFWAFAACGLTR